MNRTKPCPPIIRHPATDAQPTRTARKLRWMRRPLLTTMRPSRAENGGHGGPPSSTNVNRLLAKQLEGRAPSRPHLCVDSCMFGAQARRNSRSLGTAARSTERKRRRYVGGRRLLPGVPPVTVTARSIPHVSLGLCRGTPAPTVEHRAGFSHISGYVRKCP